MNEDGTNIFNAILDVPLEERILWLSTRAVGLRYRSFPESKLTPLDMNYCRSNEVEDEDDEKVDHAAPEDKEENREVQDDFYDGTGTMVWLAARALAWSLDQDIHHLDSEVLRLNKISVEEGSTTTGRRSRRRMVCELGCGTGMSGLAALVLANSREKEMDQSSSSSSFSCADSVRRHCLVFTDNDQESLDNCQMNCEMNHLPMDSYRHHNLCWGIKETYPMEMIGKTDIIIASDVLYDMKMVLPLFETASTLLVGTTNRHDDRKTREGDDNDDDYGNDDYDYDNDAGMMILSHVPRFCVPRNENHKDHDDDDDDDGSSLQQEGYERLDDNDDDDGNGVDISGQKRKTKLQRRHPYFDLEDHLEKQALSVGFHVIDKFRPHEHLRCHKHDHDHDDDNENNSNNNNNSGSNIGVMIPNGETRTKDRSTSSSTIVPTDRLCPTDLEQLEQAHSVIYLFQKRALTPSLSLISTN